MTLEELIWEDLVSGRDLNALERILAVVPAGVGALAKVKNAIKLGEIGGKVEGSISFGMNGGGQLEEIINKLKKSKAEEDMVAKEVVTVDKVNTQAELNTCDGIKKIINSKGYSVDEFAQLLHPDRILSDSEKFLVDSVRKEIGLPSADTLMCKTTPQSDIYKYLYNQYDAVRGFTAVEEHGASLKTLLDKYNGARLNYNDTAFKTTSGVDGISHSVGLPDKFYGTIEYKVNDVDKISIPNWKPKPDDYPYTGKAFTGSTDVVLPEYFQDRREFVDGDIIKIIDSSTGKVVQQYIYDMDTDTKWVMIGEN